MNLALWTTLLLVLAVAEARIKGGKNAPHARFLKSDKSSSTSSGDEGDLLVCPNNPGTSYNYPDGFCEICSKDNENNNARPESLAVQYVGLNSQNSLYQDERRASCRQSNGYPASADITVHGATYPVVNGTVFTIPGPFNAETVFDISGFGGCFIHTSCSQPLVAGDVIGPFRILAGNSCEVNNPTTDACCVICDRDNRSRPPSLTFSYRSEGRNPVYQDRSDCSAGIYPVDAIVTMNDQTFTVGDGDTFVVNGSFEANTDVRITRAGFHTTVCTIHTSCSQPLVAGDQFGPLLLVEGNSCDIPVTTMAPSITSSSGPTLVQSNVPSVAPSGVPSSSPTIAPSDVPTMVQSGVPSLVPSLAPSSGLSSTPSFGPSSTPSGTPTVAFSSSPTTEPSLSPTAEPSSSPTVGPSSSPTGTPSAVPVTPPCLEIVQTSTIPCFDPIHVRFDWAGVPLDVLSTLVAPNASTIDEIGIYPCSENFLFPRFAEVWQRTCSLGCSACSEPRYSGEMVFDSLPPCNQFSSAFRWPPGPAGDFCVKAILYREGPSSPPYIPICQSQEITITGCP